jgi:hypothetical protein
MVPYNNPLNDLYKEKKVCVQLKNDHSVNGLIVNEHPHGLFIASISGKLVFVAWESIVMIEPLEK